MKVEELKQLLKEYDDSVDVEDLDRDILEQIIPGIELEDGTSLSADDVEWDDDIETPAIDSTESEESETGADESVEEEAVEETETEEEPEAEVEEKIEEEPEAEIEKPRNALAARIAELGKY